MSADTPGEHAPEQDAGPVTAPAQATLAERLLRCLRSSAAVDTFAPAWSRQAQDPDLRAECSRWRHCLLRPLAISAGARVLEIGCGFGALTRYLGEIGAQVTAITNSAAEQAVCSERCRDLPNVTCRNELPAVASTFDWILLGPRHELGFEPLLQQARVRLAAGGRLVFGRGNPLGIDRLGWPGTPGGGCPVEPIDQAEPVEHAELEACLRRAGYPFWTLYYPFPDLREPRVVISERGLLDPQLDLGELLLEARATPFSRLALAGANRATLAELAGASLVVAAPAPLPEPVPEILAWTYAMERKPQFCTESQYFRPAATELAVRRLPLQAPALPCAVQGPHGALIEQRLGESACPAGPALIPSRCLTQAPAVGSTASVQDLLPWFEYLCTQAGLRPADPGFAAAQRLAVLQLSGALFDCTPDRFRPGSVEQGVRSPEWQSTAPVPLGWVLLRGCSRVLQFAQHPSADVEAMLRHLCALRALDFSDAELLHWATLEQTFQSLVREAPLSLTEVLRPTAGVSAGAEATVSQSVLTLAIGKRDEQIQALNRVLVERSERAAHLNRTLAERDSRILGLEEEQAAQQAQFHAQLDDLRARLDQQQQISEAVQNSNFWRATAPLRAVVHQARRGQALLRLVPKLRALGQGWSGAVDLLLRAGRSNGVAGLRALLREAAAWAPAASAPRPGGAREDTPANGIGQQAPVPDAAMAPQAEPVSPEQNYREWVQRYDTLDEAGLAQIRRRVEALVRQPLFSLLLAVPAAEPMQLRASLDSVLTQLYGQWQLCLAITAGAVAELRAVFDEYRADPRILVVEAAAGTPVAGLLNLALQAAHGDYVARLDVGHTLTETALYWLAAALDSQPGTGLLYTDEDRLDESGRRVEPRFKCAWNPELFLAQNYLGHMTVYPAERVRALGGYRSGFDGAEDYDLALRLIEQLQAPQIVHIPRVLYHARELAVDEALTAALQPDALRAGQRALQEHLQRCRVPATVHVQAPAAYRVEYALPEPLPLVSLIIPTRNRIDLLRNCLSSVLERTEYPAFEIIVVDNDSDDPATVSYLQTLAAQDPRVRVVHESGPFNFARLNNVAVRRARGAVLGLLNNDLEVITPGWLSEMLSVALRPGTGAVGARLWYPNDTLQHAGVVLGIGYVAGHVHKDLPRNAPGYCWRAQLRQCFSAVTAACLLVRRALYEELGGMDEVNLPIAFNDVDFCLRLQAAGYRNVWTPYAELYHHESASRGKDSEPARRQSFGAEVAYMKTRWGHELQNDPSYSPNLSLLRTDFAYAWPPRLELLGYAAKAQLS